MKVAVDATVVNWGEDVLLLIVVQLYRAGVGARGLRRRMVYGVSLKSNGGVRRNTKLTMVMKYECPFLSFICFGIIIQCRKNRK